MIYLLEDDGNIRDFVLYALSGQGYEAKGFERPSLFWNAMEEQLPELVLLDIMLPETDGLTVLRRLRENPKTRKLPVIILSARDTEYDRVLGLDNGADDYLPKPFGMLELFSRIRAVLRRAEPAAQVLRDGALEVHCSRHQVLLSGREILLTPKEYDLLVLLLKNTETVLSRTAIQEAVWGAEDLGLTRTVDVHIRTLRQKLEDCGNGLETVRGVGYRWRRET